MTAPPAPPLSREDIALATWERDLAVIRRDLRYEIAKAAAAGELTPARRTRITEDHVFAVAAASARLMEATARGPYPAGRAQRGERGA